MHLKKAAIALLATLSLLYAPMTLAKLYGNRLCKIDGYHCVTIKRGQSWKSLWPNPHERDIVMRINRMNTQVYAGIRVAVPDNLSHANIMDFAPFPKHIDATQEKVLVVDPLVSAWAAYDSDGALVRWGPASTGADYCRDIEKQCHTHPGSYRVYTMGNSSCYSRKFPLPDGGAPMPYCMYFNNGQALHGEPNGLPGYNASHGCVRLYVNDAEWLRYSFVEGPNASNDYRGTTIAVGDNDTPEEREDEAEDQDSDPDYY